MRAKQADAALATVALAVLAGTTAACTEAELEATREPCASYVSQLGTVQADSFDCANSCLSKMQRCYGHPGAMASMTEAQKYAFSDMEAFCSPGKEACMAEVEENCVRSPFDVHVTLKEACLNVCVNTMMRCSQHYPPDSGVGLEKRLCENQECGTVIESSCPHAYAEATTLDQWCKMGCVNAEESCGPMCSREVTAAQIVMAVGGLAGVCTAVLAACVLIYCCLCKKKAEQGGGEPQNQKFHRVHDRSHHDDHHDDRHDDHDHDDRRRRRRRHDDDDDYDQP